MLVKNLFEVFNGLQYIIIIDERYQLWRGRMEQLPYTLANDTVKHICIDTLKNGRSVLIVTVE